MTVSSQVSKINYAGNDATTAFATTFYFILNSHLKVILTVDATGVETVQAEGTEYTVTGAGEKDASGIVTMITAPATGETLTIKRDMPLTQGIDFVNNGPFPAETQEQGLDEGAMNAQENNEKISRALLLPESTGLSDLIIPAPIANRGIKFNPTADGIVLTNDDPDDASDSATAAAASATAAADSATAAQTAETNAETAETNAETAETNAAASAAAAAAVQEQLVDAGGTANALTADFAPDVSLTDKTRIKVRATLANTAAAVVINVDGLGNKNIRAMGNNALRVGSIQPGMVLDLIFNAAGDYWLWATAFNSEVGIFTPTGTADALVFAPDVPVQLVANHSPVVTIKITGANTVTNPTLNVSGTGVKAIKKHGNQALAVGDLATGMFAIFIYHQTNDVWELLNTTDAANVQKSTVTTAGDILYASAASVLARLGITADKKLFGNAAGTAPEWASGFKVSNISYDVSTATGTQVVTGIGFKPSAIIMVSGIEPTGAVSWGFADSTQERGILGNSGGVIGQVEGANALAGLIVSSGNQATAVISTFDSDGFTLSWTKTGTPTGTAFISFIALR